MLAEEQVGERRARERRAGLPDDGPRSGGQESGEVGKRLPVAYGVVDDHQRVGGRGAVAGREPAARCAPGLFP